MLPVDSLREQPLMDQILLVHAPIALITYEIFLDIIRLKNQKAKILLNLIQVKLIQI
ncbi:Uncharacterised protein [Legionella steigerwaltii]|uniref:Uncharacterized protein n=1 Tax=Legionella steigerwaltii TaxID=460 RepID=A0A378LDQ2_9GAMM|nr:hypothetical protein Lstg_2808 [Legionella steigerwaltii]STY23899.1 Uncharacterised protein [Legionella steigerwaltii]